MKKQCTQCSAQFTITNADLDFYDKVSPSFNGEKYQIPPPTLCPDCRHIRRHGHINDYNFYTRCCDSCNKSLVSTFPPTAKYTVFCHDCWLKDTRDDKEMGRSYDFERPFFEQFSELQHDTPQLCLTSLLNENCDYSESVAHCKNCYLISESSNCEDCHYCYWIQKTINSSNCGFAHECELCYDITDCFNCVKLRYSRNCSNCHDSYFLDNCIGCKNCLFCTNLRQKQYYIHNKKYSKEGYFSELEKLHLQSYSSIESLKSHFATFLETQPRKYLQIENAENSTGNYIRNAKNCSMVYHCYDAEECSYGEHVWRGAKYCMDSNTAGRNAELLYETTNCGIDSYNIAFSRYCWGSTNVEYCSQCVESHFLFGCTNLKPGSRYCILNTQYSESDFYEICSKIRDKMIEGKEYGEFFPLKYSLFGYNNSVSGDTNPLEKKYVEQKGWKWENAEGSTKGLATVDIGSFDNIDVTEQSICNEILECKICFKNYKIIKQEYAFHKEQGLPLPQTCALCRHRERLKLRSSRKLYDRTCSKCSKEMQTTYAPDRPEKVYCEECYLKEVY